jgi:hypothetical protein
MQPVTDYAALQTVIDCRRAYRQQVLLVRLIFPPIAAREQWRCNIG